LRRALIKSGFPFALNSFELQESCSRLTGPRRYGLLLASRTPVEPVLQDFDVPWPERILVALIRFASGAVLVYTTHIAPGASNAWIKIEMLEGLYRGLARSLATPRILCGDFNTPQLERSDGTVVTWGQDVSPDGRATVWGSWKGDTGKRWDSAERRVLVGLARFDLTDVFRSLYGYKRQEYSWYAKNRGRVIGRRFDHVFASAFLKPISCKYIHPLREQRLSDHSPIEVTFAERGQESGTVATDVPPSSGSIL
jgi:exonuclease III